MMEKSFDERCAAFDENYPRVLEQIAQAAVQAGRRPEEVTLLAATKTVPLEVVNHAISRGLSCIGENRVQELLEKYDGLDRAHCDVQFIGQLQTNKVKYLMGKVSCIQSVGSVRLAREISRLCQRENTTMKVLIEVNIGREESKGGGKKRDLGILLYNGVMLLTGSTFRLILTIAVSLLGSVALTVLVTAIYQGMAPVEVWMDFMQRVRAFFA